jgi:hypothetical protein
MGTDLGLLFQAAEALDDEWELGHDPDSLLIPFEDDRVSMIEHVFHELGHAALLGVKFGPRLSKRVSGNISGLIGDTYHGARSVCLSKSQRNEIETFGVVMTAIRKLGFDFDIRDMVAGVLVQVDILNEQEVCDFWKWFMDTKRCERAADRIIKTLKRHIPKT